MSTVTTREVPVSAAPHGLPEATIEFVRAFDAWLKRTSLTAGGESMARLRLLNELHCNGPRKMADLADSLDVTPRAITAIVDALEAEDQVHRVPHPSDRRITMIEITDGAATVEAQFHALRQAVSGLFEGIPGGDLAAFERTIAQLAERFEGGPASAGC